MFRKNLERKGKKGIVIAISCMALAGAVFSVGAGSHFVENAYAMTEESGITEESDMIEEAFAAEDLSADALTEDTEAIDAVEADEEPANKDTQVSGEALDTVETADTAETMITADDATVPFADQQIDAMIYTDEEKTEEITDISIEVDGYLPENALVYAYPVSVEIEGEETYAAYQITILDETGAEYHSEIDDGQIITVTIHDESLTEMLANSQNARGWHKDDEEFQDLTFEILEDGGVQFEADEF